MTADLRQHLRLIGADVKHLLLFLCREGIEAHRKNGQLARAAGGFKQAIRIGVIARWRIGIDIAHAGDVIVVMRVTAIVLNVFVLHAVIVKFAEDLLWRYAQIDPQMVNQRQLAVFIDTGKQRHLRVGRAALHQRAAGVIADPTDHRGANARRADHRVRFATQRLKRLFQRVERGAGEGEYLFALVQQVQFVEAQGADNHDVTIVIVAVRRGAFSQAGVSSLH